jgi:hypothetical protein
MGDSAILIYNTERFYDAIEKSLSEYLKLNSKLEEGCSE